VVFQVITSSPIKGYARRLTLAETQEMMPDFCSSHNITADIELINIRQINEAYERLLKSDVKYRFVIDMASLKK